MCIWQNVGKVGFACKLATPVPTAGVVGGNLPVPWSLQNRGQPWRIMITTGFSGKRSCGEAGEPGGEAGESGVWGAYFFSQWDLGKVWNKGKRLWGDGERVE